MAWDECDDMRHSMSFYTTSKLEKIRRHNDPVIECADCGISAEEVGGAAKCTRTSEEGHRCTYSLCPECYFQHSKLRRADKKWNNAENQKYAPRCPAGHKLYNMVISELHDHSGYPMKLDEYHQTTFICDACFVFKSDTNAFHCPLCRYELCTDCYTKARHKNQKAQQ